MERIIYSTYYDDIIDNYNRDDAREYLEEDFLGAYVTEEDIDDFVFEHAERDIKEEQNAMEEFLARYGHFLIVGSIKHFDQTHPAGKVVDSFAEILNSVPDGNDHCFYEDSKGRLYLHFSDRYNSGDFEIRVLSDDGYNEFEDWNFELNYNELNEMQIHSFLFENFCYAPCYLASYGFDASIEIPNVKEVEFTPDFA